MTNERQLLNRQLAQMLKGGVIMDVTTPCSRWREPHERPQDDSWHPGGCKHPCDGKVPYRPHR